jgi:tetratricopeptide (TPR) repeat protein
MSHYVHGTSLKYKDYLQLASFEEGITSQISKSSREIIGSNEEVARQNARISSLNTSATQKAMQELTGSVTEGFEQISYDLGRISNELRDLTTVTTEGFADISATLNWGFSELIFESRQMNASLKDLIKLAQTPGKNWNYEQFNDAREAMRRELFEDALECITKAIEGDSNHGGFKLEFRFHMLLGQLRLGSRENHGDIVDLPKAEAAFLEAAKYARMDHPADAAKAMLGAGWAAYCQGNVERGLSHTDKSLELSKPFFEGEYQRSKFLMHQGEVRQGLEILKRCIRADRRYALKAAGDGDFVRHNSELNQCLDQVRHEADKEIVSHLIKWKIGLEGNNGSEFMEDELEKIGSLSKNPRPTLFSAFDDAKATNQLFERVSSSIHQLAADATQLCDQYESNVATGTAFNEKLKKKFFSGCSETTKFGIQDRGDKAGFARLDVYGDTPSMIEVGGLRFFEIHDGVGHFMIAALWSLVAGVPLGIQGCSKSEGFQSSLMSLVSWPILVGLVTGTSYVIYLMLRRNQTLKILDDKLSSYATEALKEVKKKSRLDALNESHRSHTLIFSFNP